MLALAVIQLALALHVRNTVLDAAAEGARHAALAGSSEEAGIARTRELIGMAVSTDYADDIEAGVSTVDGIGMVSVTVRAPLPVIGLLGIDRALEVTGHAALETLE
ncbi:hypothetical protein JOE59_000801 [Agromyces cerinus]|nr:hypothetical protein [Agromyces cerinus]